MGVPHRGHGHVATARGHGVWRGARRRRLGEQRAGEGQARGPTATGEIAKLPDADKPARQDMLDEASEKLHRRHGHRAPAGRLAVVLPAKRDALAVEGEQAVIADRDAMRVAPEIAQHRRRAAKGGLGVDDPVGVEERVDEGVPLRGIAQRRGGAREIEFAAGVRATQGLDKLAAKHPTEDLHRQEEAGIFWTNPALVIRRQAPGRDDAVHVRVTDEGLSPGVENAQDPDLGAEMLRVGGDLEQGGRAQLKQPPCRAASHSDTRAAAAHAGA